MLLVVSAVLITNEVLGSETLSSFEPGKRYSRPIDCTFLPFDSAGELVNKHSAKAAKP